MAYRPLFLLLTLCVHYLDLLPCKHFFSINILPINVFIALRKI